MKRIQRKFWQLLGYESPRLEPVFFANSTRHGSHSGGQVVFNENKLRSSCHWDVDDVPDLDLPPPFSPMTPTGSPYWNHLDINLNYNFFNDMCCTPTSHHKRCDHRIPAVVKIDEVLTQIDDIKKSIVEIDSQIFDFSAAKCVSFNPAFLTLTNTDLTESDDVFQDEDGNDLNDEHHLDTDSEDSADTSLAQELNLEWDLSDVDTDSMYYGSEELDIGSSQLSLGSSVRSLPVTDTEKQKLKSMQELLEDAKQLGLLNTILDALSCKVTEDKNLSRDSAYFED